MNKLLSILKLTESWQKTILADLESHQLIEIELKQTVVHLITIVLSLYLAEQRHLVKPGQLRSLCKQSETCIRLIDLWQTFCLQAKNDFLQITSHASPCLTDRTIQKIIYNLYHAIDQDLKPDVSILGQVYENILATFESYLSGKLSSQEKLQKAKYTRTRKLGGIYYTPQPIIEYIVEHTIKQNFSAQSLPSMVDPACGGGAFLLAAYQALLDCQLQYYLANPSKQPDGLLQQNQAGQWQLSLVERQRLLQAIHGVDIDPQAVAITRLSLWLKLFEDVDLELVFERTNQTNFCGKILSSNICCGNAVIDFVEPNSFNWQTAFPEVFAAGGFDYVIGNPPYVDAEWMAAHLPHWRSYCAAHYQTAAGNWDLFCVFVEKALQICRYGGLSSLVVPNKLLAADYAKTTRQLLSQMSYVKHIRDYSQVSVFAASVYPLVYIAQKIGINLNINISATTYERMQTIDQIAEVDTVMLRPLVLDDRPWSFGICVHFDLLQRLHKLPKLGEIIQVTGSATVAEAYLLQPLIQEDAALEDNLQIVNSGTIDRYRLLWGQKPCRYLGQIYQHPVITKTAFSQLPAKRLLQAKQPKIIVAGMARYLECVLDSTGGVLAGKSTSVIQPSEIQAHRIQATDAATRLDLYYLLGLLNSHLLSFYFITHFSGNRLQGGYFRVGPPQLRQLPIVIPTCLQETEKYQNIIDLVKQRLALEQSLQQFGSFKKNELKQHNLLNPQIQKIERKIDEIVYDLYQLADTEIQTVEQTIGQSSLTRT